MPRSGTPLWTEKKNHWTGQALLDFAAPVGWDICRPPLCLGLRCHLHLPLWRSWENFVKKWKVNICRWYVYLRHAYTIATPCKVIYIHVHPPTWWWNLVSTANWCAETRDHSGPAYHSHKFPPPNAMIFLYISILHTDAFQFWVLAGVSQI